MMETSNSVVDGSRSTEEADSSVTSRFGQSKGWHNRAEATQIIRLGRPESSHPDKEQFDLMR